MSKNKGREFHDNQEVKDVLNVESKILDSVNIIEQLPISSTVKINNPGEEIKITIDNMTNVGESKEELLPEVVEEMNKAESIDVEVKIINNPGTKTEAKEQAINILDVKKSKQEKEEFNPLEELKKGFAKISIVDVSKKKSDKKKNHSNPVKSAFEKVIAMSPVSKEDVEEKAFDSLIYLGGGFIAATHVASKTFAEVGSRFIKK